GRELARLRGRPLGARAHHPGAAARLPVRLAATAHRFAAAVALLARRQQRLRLAGGGVSPERLVRELAVDEVEAVLAPESFAVDDEERRAEHALLDRVPGVGVPLGRRLRRRARLHHRVGIEAAAGDDALQRRRIAGVLLLG